ncbi:hypothetical protein FT663_02200 [Candidozyma haemuli var. vulneris]|nr:hypothetical protein FT662_02399 [[Candida] haemuloni var. vulneris]KAF3992687.1 hypothetical protein FT663_02200 [[Candida] haemuloni var. vulneris]
MSDLLVLILLALFMAATSFAAGFLPWKFGLPLHQLDSVIVASMGILVGTVLVLVIPEGAETLFEGRTEGPHILSTSSIGGISLLVGFMLMFLVDQYTVAKDASPSAYSDDSSWLARFESTLYSTLTVGLMLHSFVDGIALGSSFFHQENAFHMFLFFMIIIHKLPTAFSLAVVLHTEGFAHSVVNFHLLLFSLSTPFSSLLTYGIISAFKLDNDVVLGILLLFSAGTFLYSVIHVMMEVLERKQNKADYDPDSKPVTSSFTGTEISLTVVGMVLPILFSVAGAH